MVNCCEYRTNLTGLDQNRLLLGILGKTVSDEKVTAGIMASLQILGKYLKNLIESS